VKEQKIQIANQHLDTYGKVEKHLSEQQHIPRTAPIMKQYAGQLLDYLNQSYFAPMPYKDQLLAREQGHLARAIRDKVRKQQLILRQTDKSNHFYVGSKVTFETKVAAYFADTHAFVQLTDNPLVEITDKVIRLLEQLSSKKLILQWQKKMMLPNAKKSELSHLYFNPKTHKVLC
jgi:hypothetical protein